MTDSSPSEPPAKRSADVEGDVDTSTIYPTVGGENTDLGKAY